MDALSQRSKLLWKQPFVPAADADRAKPAARPKEFHAYQSACTDSGLSNKNKTFRALWDGLVEQAEARAPTGAPKVRVQLHGKQITMGYYRNHGSYGWCIHRRSLGTLKEIYEAKVAQGRRIPIEHGGPMLPNYNSRGSLVLAFGIDHYGDSGFSSMWEQLESLARDQARKSDGTVTVIFNEQPVTMGFFQETSGRSRWYVHDDSIPVLRKHIEAQRARDVSTANVKERYWFGPLQVCSELGITRDHGGFKHTWSQVVAVAGCLPNAGDRARIHGPGGDVEVTRGGQGEKLKRLSISRESLPVFSRALERQRDFERINWRANCSNASGREHILTQTFTERWAALDKACGDLDLLTGIPSARAALLMGTSQLEQAMKNVTNLVARDEDFLKLIDSVCDSHAAAKGQQPALFSR